jgi:hypothetical protein
LGRAPAGSDPPIEGAFDDVDFKPDGRTLVVAGPGVFLLDPLLLSGTVDEWSRRLCPVANRELTKLERRRYLGVLPELVARVERRLRRVPGRATRTPYEEDE